MLTGDDLKVLEAAIAAFTAGDAKALDRLPDHLRQLVTERST
jgi:hypothetical protein